MVVRICHNYAILGSPDQAGRKAGCRAEAPPHISTHDIVPL
jgi:hypothetical protein